MQPLPCELSVPCSRKLACCVRYHQRLLLANQQHNMHILPIWITVRIRSSSEQHIHHALCNRNIPSGRSASLQEVPTWLHVPIPRFCSYPMPRWALRRRATNFLCRVSCRVQVPKCDCRHSLHNGYIQYCRRHCLSPLSSWLPLPDLLDDTDRVPPWNILYRLGHELHVLPRRLSVPLDNGLLPDSHCLPPWKLQPREPSSVHRMSKWVHVQRHDQLDQVRLPVRILQSLWR